MMCLAASSHFRAFSGHLTARKPMQNRAEQRLNVPSDERLPVCFPTFHLSGLAESLEKWRIGGQVSSCETQTLLRRCSWEH